MQNKKKTYATQLEIKIFIYVP